MLVHIYISLIPVYTKCKLLCAFYRFWAAMLFYWHIFMIKENVIDDGQCCYGVLLNHDFIVLFFGSDNEAPFRIINL